MYVTTVFAHSVLRWVVLIAGAVAVWRAYRGRSRSSWTTADNVAGLAFMVAMDLQFLVGAVLFVKSPITILGMHELDLTVKFDTLRFFTFVHPAVMLAAFVFVHVGRVKARRASDPRSKHSAALRWFGLALFLIVVATPWPFLAYGRPLLEWLQ